MDRFRARIERVFESCVENTFPELSDIEIVLDIEKGTDELLGYGEVEGGYYIDVDKYMRKANDTELYGGVAHELAHISMDVNKSYLARLVTDIVYSLGMKYQKKNTGFINTILLKKCFSYVSHDERNTDLLVVQKGAGEELLAFLRFHDKYFKKYEKKDGLTVSELENLLRSEDR